MGKADIYPIFSILSANAFSESTNSNFNCIYSSFRHYFIFGKFLGIIPLQGLLKANKNLENVHSRYFSIASLISSLISALLISCLIVEIIGIFMSGKTLTTELVTPSSHCPFFTYGSFIYIYFLRNSKVIIKIFQKWKAINIHFTKEDSKLPRDTFLTAAIMFTSAVVDNMIYHAKNFKPYSGQSESVLEFYYHTDQKFWANLMSYNPVLSVLLFLANKLCWYAWNYTDIFIALIGRALYFQFQALYEVAQEQWGTLKKSDDKESRLNFWVLLQQDHVALCKLVENFSDFLSPLIFASYSVNLYNICMRVNALMTGKAASQGFVATLYNMWSFAHLTGRVLIFSLNAAKLNDFAHGIRKLYFECPNDCYSPDVEKGLIRATCGYQIGFHGLHCFYITKSFFLAIISVIFTIEILLLQIGSQN